MHFFKQSSQNLFSSTSAITFNWTSNIEFLFQIIEILTYFLDRSQKCVYLVGIQLMRRFLRCCKLVQNLLKTQLTKQTQRSKVLHNRHVRHVNSRRRSSAGWPIKGQGTPSRRGFPQVQQYYNNGYINMYCMQA